MDKKVACVLISCFALANAGLIPIQSAKYLEGPSTRTQVVGPDGSVIDAYAPGGRILLEGQAGPLVQPAPVVLAQPAVAAPQLYSSGLELQQQVVLAEPSTNSVEATASGEAQRVLLHPGTPERVESRESVPITEETDEAPLATTELPATTEYNVETSSDRADLSRTYVPDNFERLFDDGSYRPEHF